MEESQTCLLSAKGFRSGCVLRSGHVPWEGRVTLTHIAQRGGATSAPVGVSRFTCSVADLIHYTAPLQAGC